MGVDYLLDTHTLLWALITPANLSLQVLEIMENPSHTLFVSSASIWELATKFRIGKLPEAQALLTNMPYYLQRLTANELPISHKHALLAGQFQVAHRDPFDRMLAAQASLENLPLISKDPVFGQFDIQVIWD